MGGMVLVAASRRRTGCPDLGEDISFAGHAAGFSCTNRDCAVSFWGQWDDYKKKHNIEEWEKLQADGADQAGQGYKQQGDKQQEEKKDEKNDAAPAAPEEAKPSEDGKEKPENVIWVPEQHEDKDDDEDDDEPPVPAAVAKSAAKKNKHPGRRIVTKSRSSKPKRK